MAVLAPLPHERVLEVGCGTGRAAELIAAQLDHGRMLAIDRSPIAVAKTVDRTAAAIDRGVLRVERGTLAALTAPQGAFDLAFAINVNVFWTEPASEELAVLHRVLAPGGRLGILYGRGPQDDSGILPVIAERLSAHGFTNVRIISDKRGHGVLATR